MEVYLVRHTETIAGVDICYGQTDVDLKSPYIEEFEKIKKLIDIDNAVLYSSPLKRCTQLASFISDNNAEIIIDERLKELNFGSWEMKNWNDIDKQELDLWMSDFVNAKVPGGESFVDLNNRVMSFINDEILSNRKSKIVVCHSGIIRSFLCRFNNKALIEAFDYKIEFGEVVKLQIND